MARRAGTGARPFAVASRFVDKALEAVQEVDPLLKRMGLEERTEQEISSALREADRAQNMIDHGDEIYNRPKREWFLSGKRKREMKERSKEQIQHRKEKALEKRDTLLDKRKQKANLKRDKAFRAQKAAKSSLKK